MYNKLHIMHTFHAAARWNLIGHIVQRIAYTLLSIFLYAYVSVETYVAWTSYMSILYMAIFICDAGLRKSMPLYIVPCQYTSCMRVYIGIGCIVTVCMYIAMMWFVPYTYTMQHPTIWLITPVLCITQSLLIGMRLMFKSYLYNKVYAYISSIWPLCELTCIALWIVYASAPPIIGIIGAKSIFGLVTLLHGWWYISHHGIQSSEHYAPTKHATTSHTSYMWLVAMSKSLSERHVIMPILAWIAPPDVTAMYKVVHDSAMLLYRTIIKGIDINDITILRNAAARRYGFFQLSITMIHWVSISLMVLACFPHMITAMMQYRILLCIVGHTSLCELIGIPWERLQEIEGNYIPLITMYMCMFCTPIIFLTGAYYIVSHVPWIAFFVVVHCSRLICIGYLSRYMHQHTSIIYPWRYAITCLLPSLGMSLYIMW